jgi:hypothetical protein
LLPLRETALRDSPDLDFTVHSVGLGFSCGSGVSSTDPQR